MSIHRLLYRHIQCRRTRVAALRMTTAHLLAYLMLGVGTAQTESCKPFNSDDSTDRRCEGFCQRPKGKPSSKSLPTTTDVPHCFLCRCSACHACAPPTPSHPPRPSPPPPLPKPLPPSPTPEFLHLGDVCTPFNAGDIKARACEPFCLRSTASPMHCKFCRCQACASCSHSQPSPPPPPLPYPKPWLPLSKPPPPSPQPPDLKSSHSKRNVAPMQPPPFLPLLTSASTFLTEKRGPSSMEAREDGELKVSHKAHSSAELASYPQLGQAPSTLSVGQDRHEHVGSRASSSSPSAKKIAGADAPGQALKHPPASVGGLYGSSSLGADQMVTSDSRTAAIFWLALCIASFFCLLCLALVCLYLFSVIRRRRLRTRYTLCDGSSSCSHYDEDFRAPRRIRRSQRW